MTGYKRGLAGTQQLERAVRWMRTLNAEAADVLRGLAPNAVTDVTGFGLFGHCHEMADRSGVRIAARVGALPGDRRRARHGPQRRAHERRPAEPRLRRRAMSRPTGSRDTLVALGYDPQTAGGLLVSLPADRGATLEAEFAARKLFVRRIGRVEEGSGVVVE